MMNVKRNVKPGANEIKKNLLKSLDKYIVLLRLDKPIGSLLLLWPTLASLMLATDGKASIKLLIIFSMGVFIMRSAGCIINDIADRRFDKYVARTKLRPITTGEVTVSQALLIFTLLLAVALYLVTLLNTKCIVISGYAIILIMLYPYSKRFTNYPQLLLGAAFSVPMLMTYAAGNRLGFASYWLYLNNILWVVSFDTQYAMVDRYDDIKIGIKSTAIRFAEHNLLIITILQILYVSNLIIFGIRHGFGIKYHVSILVIVMLFYYQWLLVRSDDNESFFRAFLNNNYVGLAWFMGIYLELIT